MNRFLEILFAAILWATAASAQTGVAVKQSGFVTPGHASCWSTNGVVQDCGIVPGVAFQASPGYIVGNYTTGNPANVAAIPWMASGATCPLPNSLSNYQMFTATAGAPSATTFNVYDPTTLSCQTWATLNETTGAWAFNGTSSGNVTGPGLSVANDLACWNGTTGNILKDCAAAIGTSGGNVPLLNGVNTWSGQQIFNNGVLFSNSGNNNPSTIIATSSGCNESTLCPFADWTVNNVRSFLWSYVPENFGSGSAVNSLKLSSDLPSALNFYMTEYGFINIGNIITGYPLLSPNISDTTGPALRINGDIGAGDYLYFGSSQYAITAIGNNGSGAIRVTYAATTNPVLSTSYKIVIAGSQSALNNNSTTPNWTITVIDSTHFDLQGSTFTSTCSGSGNCGYFGTGADGEEVALTMAGGLPSCRVISPGRRDIAVTTDFSGGAAILMCPDNNLVGFSAYAAQGEIILQAYGSGVSGNDIIFRDRASASTAQELARLGSWGVNNAYGAFSFSGTFAGASFVGVAGNSGDQALYLASLGGVKFYDNNTQYLLASSSEVQPVDASTALGDGTHRFTTGSFSSTVSAVGGFIANGNTGLTQTCTVNQAKTLIFTLGILTGGTCNS